MVGSRSTGVRNVRVHYKGLLMFRGASGCGRRGRIRRLDEVLLVPRNIHLIKLCVKSLVHFPFHIEISYKTVRFNFTFIYVTPEFKPNLGYD